MHVPEPQIIVSFSILFLAIVSKIYARSDMLWMSLLGVSIGLGVVSHVVSIFAIVPAILMFFVVQWYAKCDKNEFSWPLLGSIVLIVCISLVLALHLVPGFNNPRIVNNVPITENALPYTLYWNYDKALAGILLLSLCVPSSLSHSVLQIVKQVVFFSVAAALIVLPLGMAFSFVQFSPKWPDFMLWWLPANLLITCVAEEAFFRGFIQKQLFQFFKAKKKNAHWIAIVVSAVLFGIAHIAGGATYVLLAVVAGILYGWIYHLTNRIDASIFVHFIFNFLHITLFTYPALSV